ncbi:MAG: amino acid permease, partial [Ureaplasma sp.]|nr:amino acid permease [Ureaplasma sp.]
MSKVSVKTAKKIGLVGSISLMIGSVIGIGIFFKNGSVFDTNNGNAIGILISWILASVIAFCTALSFAEIGFGKRKGAGLAGSMEAMYGQKAGRFINFNQNFFYYGILNLSIALFTAEAVFNMVPGLSNKIHVGFVFLLGAGLLVIVLVFNYLSVKWSTRFQLVASALKFLPLIAVALTGLIFGILNPENSLFNPDSLYFKPESGPKFSNVLNFNSIIVALPGILFAFDSFLSFGTIKSEMKEPRKQVPLTIIIGMIIVIVFYLFITVGQIFAGTGKAPDLFNNVFKGNEIAIKISSALLNVFILVSILGVLNSLILTGLRSFEQSIKSHLFYGYWLFNKIIQKKDDKLKSGMIIALFTYAFWFIIILI